MFEVYRDSKNEWRWRLKAKNGRIIADAGEGYKKRSAMLKSLERLKELVPTAGIIEVVVLPGMKLESEPPAAIVE